MVLEKIFPRKFGSLECPVCRSKIKGTLDSIDHLTLEPFDKLQLSAKDLETLVLEKFNVGEVYYLWQMAYKKAYGVLPTRQNRPTKTSISKY